jgi:hypothetical protein
VAPTKQTYKAVDKCTSGKNHKYDQNNVCTVCGYENKTRAYWTKQRSEKAPKRGGPAPGSAQVKQSIALMLTGTQTILLGMDRSFEEDALSAQEIAMLADVLGDEVNESPTLKRWIAKAGKQSTHIRLAVVLIMIVAPRLARRGILPAGSEQIAASVAVAARGTFDDSGGDELGEIDADGGGIPADASVPSGGADENGPLPPPDPVSSANGHQESGDLGEPKIRARRAKAKV